MNSKKRIILRDKEAQGVNLNTQEKLANNKEAEIRLEPNLGTNQEIKIF
jgi:hypothetical protein